LIVIPIPTVNRKLKSIRIHPQERASSNYDMVI
jgi:hypothetical protein